MNYIIIFNSEIENPILIRSGWFMKRFENYEDAVKYGNSVINCVNYIDYKIFKEVVNEK